MNTKLESVLVGSKSVILNHIIVRDSSIGSATTRHLPSPAYWSLLCLIFTLSSNKPRQATKSSKWSSRQSPPINQNWHKK
jgi:hypothetical protein